MIVKLVEISSYQANKLKQRKTKFNVKDIAVSMLDFLEASRCYLNVNAEIAFVRFEVFTAVTMKNVVFWDIKPQFVLHRRHITSPLHSPAS
jgi:hypothetical protein